MIAVVRFGKTKSKAVHLELPDEVLATLKGMGCDVGRCELILHRHREPRKSREVKELERLYRLGEGVEP